MKKITTILLAALALAIPASAQVGKNIYKKYSDSEDIEAVYISPAMFRLIKKLPDMDFYDKNLNMTSAVKSLDGLYIIDSDNATVTESLRQDVEKLISNGSYELLMEAKEDGETVRICTCAKDDIITSFILLAVECEECDFICIEGKMSREQVEKLMVGE